MSTTSSANTGELTWADYKAERLAAAMGVTQSFVSSLEGGGKVPDLKTLARVATAVGKHLRVDFAA